MYLEDLIDIYDLEVHQNLFQIKYYRNNLVQSLDLDDDWLSFYPITMTRLYYIDGLLRSQRFRTEDKWKTVERIDTYRLNFAVENRRDLSK